MVYSSKDFNIVDICHDSAKYASIMAFAAPKVEEPIYLPLHYSHPLLRDSKSMEKDQLISMIHFLIKREEERAQENQELKDMVRELRETRDSLMKPAHPICERWPVQYRPLSYAAWLVQELTCRTHLTPYDSRAQTLELVSLATRSNLFACQSKNGTQELANFW